MLKFSVLVEGSRANSMSVQGHRELEHLKSEIEIARRRLGLTEEDELPCVLSFL
jgi:hypothetical protein